MNDIQRAMLGDHDAVWCRPNGMRWNMLESEVTHWMPLPAPPDRRPPEQIDMLERMESE